ncbi:MAG: copper amine oxidase [Halobacteriovorax sp.]|nr:copper amine oxidase [Halobacteriovorax sp.]|tara:strand:- start:4265 stop:4735 length:471 start_codon:yes stop_codon:yes gene_type:complete
MKKSLILAFSLLMGVACTNDSSTSKKTSKASYLQQEMVVYKNPSCGCCTKWVDHMREYGFKLTEKPIDNLSEMKDSLGVPQDKRSCHTAVMGEFVFEGHVPAASIKKFLEDENREKGLVVPDMPMGSPGMEYGKHKEKFYVYSFDSTGHTKIFERY